MLKFLRTTCVLLAATGGWGALAQTPQQQAEAKGMAAIKLMDEGKPADAIPLLEEARQLDPSRSAYSYELAYSYSLQKQYPQALKLAEPLVKRPDATDRTFELLGNLYDENGNSAKAIETYQAGLRKFPASGRLQLELGVVYMDKKDYDKAIHYFEEGIRVAPAFSSNYYWAARLYCGSTEEVWGMMYGELFLNLERNSARTTEISQLLYDTYKSQIKFQGKDTVAVSFSQNSVLTLADLKKGILPYGATVYEPVLMTSTIGETAIDLAALNRIRTAFVANYYQLPFSQKYPNVLFDYERTIQQQGHLEAYNYWLLMKGDEPAFQRWQQANPEKWAAFTKWFLANPLHLDRNHSFERSQYK